MKTAAVLAFGSVFCLANACVKVTKEKPAARAELRQMMGDTFELIPTEGQLPYCLVFTRSESGVIRQLTMTHGNRSVPCETGRPIGGVRYRVPTTEGPVKVHVFFSDQRLNAGSLARELYEHKGDPSFHPMNLRLPGNVYVQTFEFNPQPPTEEATGAQIGAGGKIVAPPESARAGSTSSTGGTVRDTADAGGSGPADGGIGTSAATDAGTR
jgi:hypothetical protein